jgi:hypothetical protein
MFVDGAGSRLQIQFLNSVIVDLQQRNKEQKEKHMVSGPVWVPRGHMVQRRRLQYLVVVPQKGKRALMRFPLLMRRITQYNTITACNAIHLNECNSAPNTIMNLLP